MKLLVFGRNGQVATHLATLPGVTTLSRAEADLTDPAACAAHIAATDADAIINAAAYTAVDAAETDESTAHRINADAPGAMARAAADRGLPFVHISTDYVFDGQGDAAFAPDAPTGPLNAYGRTKLAGEEAVRAANGPHAILRTSWVFSAHGGNFVKTMLRLSQTRAALNVVDDQIGGPTPANAIADALVTMAGALKDGQKGGTYHIAGQPFTSWKCFARETFEIADRPVTLTGIPTKDYPTPALRPLNSRLDCATLRADFGITPPDWAVALSTIISELDI